MAGRRGPWVSSTGSGGTVVTVPATVRFTPSDTFPVSVSIQSLIDAFVEVAAFDLPIAANVDSVQIPTDAVPVGILANVDILSEIINPDGIQIGASVDSIAGEIPDDVLVVGNVSAIALPIDVVNGTTVAAFADQIGLDQAVAASILATADQVNASVDGNTATVTPSLAVVWDYTVPGTYSWVAPVTGTVQVEAWGGGGAGGGSTVSASGGGGGGGAYAKSNAVPVIAGNTYIVVVGAFGNSTNVPGSPSSFNSTSTVAAGGSAGGAAAGLTQGTSGPGGTTAASTGDTKFAGGAGAAGSAGGGGGGGSGGGRSVTGNNGSGTTGASAPAGGVAGAGGNGNTLAAGTDGQQAGGGGGGASPTQTAARGGGPGRAILTMVVL